MKKILMALSIVGLFHISAQAQSKKSAAQNYPVCRYGDTYAVCGDVPEDAYAAPTAIPPRNSAGDEYVNVKDDGVQKVTPQEYRTQHHIRVYDQVVGELPAYTGSPEANEYRNMNVNQSSIVLPPNTGTIK